MTYGNDDDGPRDDDPRDPRECGDPTHGDEFDVDITPETALEGEAEVECLGTYETMEAFLRSQVELLLIADGMWLLDCIDYERVHEMLEGDEYRIWRDDYGRVFRRRLPQPPYDA